jgi:hypothetical protein
MWLWATAGGSHTLAASCNLGLLGFETPAVIDIAYWTSSNIASRSQIGSKADQGQHEIARPLRRERVNFFGREQTFKGSANSSACSDRALQRLRPS